MLATQFQDCSKNGVIFSGEAKLTEDRQLSFSNLEFSFIEAPKYLRSGLILPTPVKNLKKTLKGIPGQLSLEGFSDTWVASLVPPQFKQDGRSLLTKSQKDFLRDQLMDSVPVDLGLSTDAYWSLQTVREYILSEWGIQVSTSAARSYLKKFSFNSPTPLNRRCDRTFEQQRWLSEELPLLRKPLASEVQEGESKTVPRKKNVFYISCKTQQSEDVFRNDKIQLHAVSNTGKAMFAFVPKSDRKAKLGELLHAVSGGQEAIYIFDDSITEEFRDEAVAASSYYVKNQSNTEEGRQRSKGVSVKKVGKKKYKDVVENKVRRYLGKAFSQTLALGKAYKKTIVQIGFSETSKNVPLEINRISFDTIMLGWANSSA